MIDDEGDRVEEGGGGEERKIEYVSERWIWYSTVHFMHDTEEREREREREKCCSGEMGYYDI